MANHPKDAHISDSASGGKGESMATEIRETVCGCYCHKGGGLKPCFYCANAHNFCGAVAPLRLSEFPAEPCADEIASGVGTAVESNSVDEKGLASRVEELEKLIREAIETLEMAEYHVSAEKLRIALAQPSGNTPGKEK